MAERVKRLVPGELTAGYDLSTPEEPRHEVHEGWRAEEPREEWGPWELVEVVEDEDLTYYPEHHNDGNFLRAPTLKAMHPRRRRTTTFERKLRRYWVDPDQGPMAMIVKVEHDTMRT